MTARLTDPVPPISEQQAAADRRAFKRKHANTATAEELRAELATQASRLRNFKGLSWAEIGRRIGMGKDAAHALVDPEWGARNSAKALERQARARKGATA